MFDYTICNCKKVTYFDIEDALRNFKKFEDVEKRFEAMGFDRAFPPGTPPEAAIQALRELLNMDGEN